MVAFYRDIPWETHLPKTIFRAHSWAQSYTTIKPSHYSGNLTARKLAWVIWFQNVNHPCFLKLLKSYERISTENGFSKPEFFCPVIENHTSNFFYWLEKELFGTTAKCQGQKSLDFSCKFFQKISCCRWNLIQRDSYVNQREKNSRSLRKRLPGEC